MGQSSGLAIVLAGARLLCLGVLALLLTLPCNSSVGAVTFAFSGFKENSLYSVRYSNWLFETATGCFEFDVGYDVFGNFSGRLLYPGAVQMIDPGSTAVKSFQASFIFRFQIPTNEDYVGPGMAFILVPDNVTLGAPGDFMGLITNGTTETGKNYESDNHTLGVELDTYKNPEFNDTNNNHIGINLASMNSTYSFEPDFHIASSSADLYQQMWIEYNQTDSRMDVFIANYKERKPAKPQGSQSGLDLSLLKENSFVGFSSANKLGSFDAPYICAWSFSNDGIPAPPIVIAQDATPGAPNGPVAAPSLPPSPPPPPRSPAPDISSPPPASNPPPLRAPNPSPFNPPNPPPPSSVPPQGPSGESPTIAKEAGKKKKLTGVYVGVTVAVRLFSVIVGLFIFVLCCYRSHPLRTFVIHAGGPNGDGKNFPTWLVQSLRKYFKWSNIKFFFDRDSIDHGKNIAERIFAELARSDVGIVVVTDDFFKGKWPMTELITLIDILENETTQKLRIVPLFYKLTPEDVKKNLTDEIWKPDWENMNTGKHPLEVEKCKQAVNWLCSPRGIVYSSIKRDKDSEYIQEICQVIDKILRQERSFASYIWGAIKGLRL